MFTSAIMPCDMHDLFGFSDAFSVETGGSFWLGISDIIEEDRWEYSDQTVITFNDFYPGEPNLHTQENCLVLWAPFHGRWADYDCSKPAKFICETDVS
jgi:hypothetical protein